MKTYCVVGLLALAVAAGLACGDSVPTPAHFKHIVYPLNNCVNSHIHRLLIDGVYPGDRRLVCEQEAAPPSPEQTVGTTTSLPPETEFASVTAGALHSCGVQTGGSLACWGYNDSGQATPPAGEFATVSGGGFHACGVRTDGSVSC